MKNLSGLFSEKYQVWLADPELLREESFTAGIFVKEKGLIRNEGIFTFTDLVKPDKAIPLVIVFTGKKIITRFAGTTAENLFGELDLEDFYTDTAISESGFTIQSVIRKSLVDNVMELLANMGFFPVGFSLSCNCLFALEGLAEKIVINNAGIQFTFHEHRIADISKADHGESIPVMINDEVYNSESILMPAAIVHYIRGKSLKTSITVNSSAQHKYYKLNRRFALIAITILFITAFLNYIVYSSISGRIDTLKSKNLNIESQLKQIETLEKQIKEFEMMSLNYLKSTPVPYAYYADKIASHRPAGLWLNSMDIHSFSKKIESNRPVETDISSVRISGEVRNPEMLNRFIGTVRKEHWVKEIRMIKYQDVDGANHANFEINIVK